MNLYSRFRSAGACVGLLHFVTTTTSAAPFVNGSFELPGGVSPGQFIGLKPGDARLTGWTIGGTAELAYHNGLRLPELNFSAADGDYQLVFNGGGGVSGTWIAQTFDTAIGEDYVVSFSVGRLGGGTGAVSLTASVEDNGSELARLVAVPPAHGYGQEQRFYFTAASSRTTLKFLDGSAGDIGAVDIALDKVSVAVRKPEPVIQVSQVAVSWEGVSNRTYQVQYRASADGDIWVDLGAPVRSSGGHEVILDSTFGQPVRFYRVVKVP